jgi:glycosyltransferase involved in cell wall biosynthesis
LQNQEATEILINEVWPKIKRKFGNVKIWIAGRKIPHWVKKRAVGGDIVVTEDIPDARDAYVGAYMMVAPIKGAGGTRLKILEAMAAGLPVVSTSVGVAGLDLENGKNVLISDTPKELAKSALKLLGNPSLAHKIGINGRKHVEKNFDWKSIVKLHDPIYEELIEK